MGLRKSKGNMYEWIDSTWNPIKGACLHDCSYCYMKKWGKLNPIHLDNKEFKEFDRDIKKHGDNQTIFVGSSCDIFADDIPSEWILKTLRHCNKYNNTYLFQSKNPQRFEKYLLSKTVQKQGIFATTTETNRWYPDIMQNTPNPRVRVEHTEKISMEIPVYLTIEPVMKFDIEIFLSMIKQINPIQINIGADSGGNNLPEPTQGELMDLISYLEYDTDIKVKLKRNLNRLLK